MENSFIKLISPAKEILILLPNKPYLDQVAAGLSLYLSLKQSSKNALIFATNPMTAEFSRLVGVTEIASEMGTKNLVVKFKNYNPDQIEKVNYDIDNGEFKLTIEPKTGMDAPSQNQIDVSYAGVSADLVILIGGANETHFDVLKNPEISNLNMLHIGTRLLEIESDLKILSFARQSSSTSEITASLIKESGLSIDPDIATNLLAGIEDGSRSFQNEGVSADTFILFAELLKMGGKRLPKLVAHRFPQGAIPNKPYTSKNPSIGEVPHIHMEEDIPMPEEEPKEIPSSWSEPKIFTGTSVS